LDVVGNRCWYKTSYKDFLSLSMSKEEIKNEINKVLDHLSDKTLQEILSFLRNLEGRQTVSLADHATLDKILSEDKELLEKLAR